MARRAALALLLRSSSAWPGAASGAGESEDGGATLLVTRDFGAREVGDAGQDPIPRRRDGDALPAARLRRADPLRRRLRAVDQRHRRRARRTAARSTGSTSSTAILAEDGAAAHELSPGDRVWWDHRDWERDDGRPGRRRLVAGAVPVRRGRQEDPGAARLRRRRRGRLRRGRGAARGRGREGRRPLRRRQPRRRGAAAREGRHLDRGAQGPGGARAGEGPGGLRRVRAAHGGRHARSRCSIPPGEEAGSLGAGDGLVAATRLGGEAPTWIVTGTDAAGVDAAAAQLQDDALEQHFAIAVRAGRPEPLPVQPEPETP